MQPPADTITSQLSSARISWIRRIAAAWSIAVWLTSSPPRYTMAPFSHTKAIRPATGANSSRSAA